MEYHKLGKAATTIGCPGMTYQLGTIEVDENLIRGGFGFLRSYLGYDEESVMPYVIVGVGVLIGGGLAGYLIARSL